MQSNCRNLESHRRVVPTTRNSVKEFGWLAPAKGTHDRGCSGVFTQENPATWHSRQALTMADHWHVSVMLCTYLGPAQPSRQARHETRALPLTLTRLPNPCIRVIKSLSSVHVHIMRLLFCFSSDFTGRKAVSYAFMPLCCRLSCSPPIQFPFFI